MTPVHVNIQSDPVIESLPIVESLRVVDSSTVVDNSHGVDSSPIVDNSLVVEDSVVEDSPVVETPAPLRSVTHSTSNLSATPSSTRSVPLPKHSPLAELVNNPRISGLRLVVQEF